MAREIGISHPALRDYLNGSTPRGATALRLRAWYDPGADERQRIEVATSRSPASARVPLELLRAALRRAVAASSLRKVAEQVGITHRGLQRFIAGETRPRETTTRKLREWYIKEGLGRGEISIDEARAALEVLVAKIPEPMRTQTAAAVLDLLKRRVKETGVTPPAWLDELLATAH